MNQNRRMNHQPISVWGMNLAIGYLFALSMAILLGAILLGLAFAAGIVKSGGDFVGGSVALVLCLIAGIIISGVVFSLATALTGIKLQVFLLWRLTKAAEGADVRLVSLEQAFHELGATIKNMPSMPPMAVPPTVIHDAGKVANQGDLAQLLAVMNDLHDTLLMGEPEKAAAVQRRMDQKRRLLMERFRHHLRHEEWKNAQAILQDFNLLFPDDPQQREMNDELNFDRQRKIDLDLSDAQDRIRGWISTNRWEMVEPLIAKLELQYPDDTGVVNYIQQIRYEMQSWHQEVLQNLIGQLKDASDHRQWRRATLIAQQLLEKYPDDKLVEKLRMELPTLRKNADLQEVKDLETQFKELLQRRRYDEAFPIAQKVIDEHPETAVANELVKMLPKLQELMKQDKLRRQAELGQLG